MLLLLTLLFTFLFPGFITAVFVHYVFKNSRFGSKESLLYGFIIGPVLISLLLSVLFYFLPGKQAWFYIIFIGIFFLILLVLSLKSLPAIFAQLRKIIVTTCMPFKPSALTMQNQTEVNINSIKAGQGYFLCRNFLFKLFIAIFMFHLFYQGVTKPIVTNDALIYSFLGKYISKEKSLSNYPMHKPDPETGAKFSWILHPPGLVSLYAWMHMLQGNIKSDLSSRCVAPVYTCYLLILLYFILKKYHNIYAAQISSILYIFTPVLLFQAVGNTIDPIRITLFFLAAYTFFIAIHPLRKQFRGLKLPFMTQKKNGKNVNYKTKSSNSAWFKLSVLCGGLMFLAVFFHLGNLLLIPAIVTCFILVTPRLKFRKSILVFYLLAIICLQYFIWNTHPHDNKVFALASMNPKYHINMVRRLNAFDKNWQQLVKDQKVSPLKIFWHERLRFLSAVNRFGITSYLALISLLFLFLYTRLKPPDIFFLVISATIAPIILIKYYLNYRYISTLMPEFVYFAATGIGFLFVVIRYKYRRLLILYHIGLILLLFIISGITVKGLIGYSSPSPDSSNMFVANLQKFSCWKRYTNPVANLCLIIRHSQRDKPAIAVTTRQLLPEYYYYLPPGRVLSLNDADCINILNNNIQTAKSGIERNKISFILTTPEYSKNTNILKMVKSGYLSLIDSQRGYNLFSTQVMKKNKAKQ